MMKLLILLILAPLLIVSIAYFSLSDPQISKIKEEARNLVANLDINPQYTPKPTAKPTPIPLTPGIGTYMIGQSDKTGPIISGVEFNPLDVKKGQKLTVSVKTKFAEPITKVSATLLEDSSKQILEFKLTEGSAADGIWESTITLSDSVNYKYILTVTAFSNSKAATITVAPRS